jgi:hypothetical protein
VQPARDNPVGLIRADGQRGRKLKVVALALLLLIATLSLEKEKKTSDEKTPHALENAPATPRQGRAGKLAF